MFLRILLIGLVSLSLGIIGLVVVRSLPHNGGGTAEAAGGATTTETARKLNLDRRTVKAKVTS